MIDYDSMSREELIDELKEAQQEIGELRSQLEEYKAKEAEKKVEGYGWNGSMS